MKVDKVQELNARITKLAARAKLNSWNSFVEELQVPSEIYPALLTNRMELLKLAKPRELSVKECAGLYQLIGGLIETNSALREHAAEVAHQTKIWADAFKQLHAVGQRIEKFAQFKHDEIDTEEVETA